MVNLNARAIRKSETIYTPEAGINKCADIYDGNFTKQL